MNKRARLGLLFLGMALVCVSHAAVVLDVDFSEFTAGSSIKDGTRIRDTSGNGYHGFWGQAAGGYDIVDTFDGGVGVNTTSKTAGHVFLRAAMTGVPEEWDGDTTTVTPYFTLEAGTDYTFESVVKFGASWRSAGRDGLMGQIGGNEAWIRADGGYLQYAFVSGSSVTEFGTNINVRSAYDGGFHNITVVLDRTVGEIRTYLDGALLHTDTNTGIATLGEMLNGTADFRVGAYNITGADAFTGIQDQYRISNTVLATNEFLTVPVLPPDFDAPTPNPATFASAPAAISDSTIEMTATTGTDASGIIEYLFTETSGNPGGTSSGWIGSPVYTDDGLDPDTTYTYTVTLRDPTGNTGTASDPASATTEVTPLGLIGLNLAFETAGTPPTPWISTSIGSSPMAGNAFRTAPPESAWFNDGSNALLLEMNPADTEAGRLSQALTGTAAAGTYTWTLSNVGLANFGAKGGGSLIYGFSLDGINFIDGSSATFVEGTSYFSPATGLAASGAVTYVASGAEPALYLMFETGVGNAVRTVSTVGSTTLEFVQTIDPSPTFLTVESGVGTVTISCTNLTAIAGVINTLQSCDNLLVGNWVDVSAAVGVTETNWVVGASNHSFYRIKTTW